MWNLLEDPIPINMFGDSSILVFKDRLYERADGLRIVCKVFYLNGFRGETLTDVNGDLAEQFVGMLLASGLIVESAGRIVAMHALPGRHWRRVAVALDRKIAPPIVFLSFGLLDQVVFMTAVGSRDYPIPAALAVNGFVVEKAATTDFIEERELRNLLDAAIVPYERAIRRLHEYGLSRIFVSSIAPVTRSNAMFEFYFSLNTTIEQRYRATMLLNYELEKMCVRVNASFVDSWPKQIGSGPADTELLRDHVHLRRDKSRLTIEALCERAPLPGERRQPHS